MNSFLLNIVLALTWCAASGAVTALNFAIGFILGYGILSVQTEITRSESYRKKLFHFSSFTLYFFWEVIMGALDVSAAILWPFRKLRPGILAVPLDTRSTAEHMLLANVISLTPGTLVVDVAPDGNVLYVHVMDIDSPEKVCARIKNGLEFRLMQLFD